MQLALLVHLDMLRQAGFSGERIYSREEVMEAVTKFCAKHGIARPDDQAIADAYNNIKPTAMSRELGII